MPSDPGLTRFDRLLMAWQYGEATVGDLHDLEALLKDDAECRRALVNLSLIDAHLHGSKALRPRSRSRILEFAAAGLVAAAAIIAVTVALVRSGDRTEGPRRIESNGTTWGRFALADGGEMRLAPGAAGLLQADDAFELSKGGGSFVSTRAFLVNTTIGAVKSEGPAEFTVDVSDRALTVGVAAGSVEVRYAGVRLIMGPGEKIAYGLPSGARWEDMARWPRLVGRARMLSLKDAISKALLQETGTPVRAGLEDADDEHPVVYAVELAQGRQRRELAIHAITGDVLENELEGGDASAVAAGARMPLAEAVEKATATVEGWACGAALEQSEGRTHARVAIVADGRVIEVVVDASTGSVLRISVI